MAPLTVRLRNFSTAGCPSAVEWEGRAGGSHGPAGSTTHLFLDDARVAAEGHDLVVRRAGDLQHRCAVGRDLVHRRELHLSLATARGGLEGVAAAVDLLDRKSTRLNSSHVEISYAVFCLKKKTRATTPAALAMAPRAALSTSLLDPPGCWIAIAVQASWQRYAAAGASTDAPRTAGAAVAE